MAITHSEFGYATGALEAARAFEEEIRGTIGELFLIPTFVSLVFAVCFVLGCCL